MYVCGWVLGGGGEFDHCEASLKPMLAYPVLLSPAFVTCSTNPGEGLVKLIMSNDVPGCWGGHVEERYIPSIQL